MVHCNLERRIISIDPISRILAIDYGSKRIGIALSDPMRIFAKPLCVIENTNPPDVIAAIKALLCEHKVGLLLCGIPYSLDGLNTPKTDETIAFMQDLEKHLEIPVKAWNESLSTDTANNELKKMGYDWKKSRTMIDAMAACMILKSYLETTNT